MKSKDNTQNNKELSILKAAEREFLTKGFAGARTVAIAEAAGVTHAMLHYYFRSKEHLFERILDDKIGMMGELMLVAFGQPNLPIADRIRDGLERHFDFIAANPDLPRFIVNEIFMRPERYQSMQKRLAAIIGKLMGDFQQELDMAAERGETEKLDVRMLMLDIIALNVFPFITYPIAGPVLGFSQNERDHFFELRKRENIETIMRRIKKL